MQNFKYLRYLKLKLNVEKREVLPEALAVSVGEIRHPLVAYWLSKSKLGWQYVDGAPQFTFRLWPSAYLS